MAWPVLMNRRLEPPTCRVRQAVWIRPLMVADVNDVQSARVTSLTDELGKGQQWTATRSSSSTTMNRPMTSG